MKTNSTKKLWVLQTEMCCPVPTSRDTSNGAIGTSGVSAKLLINGRDEIQKYSLSERVVGGRIIVIPVIRENHDEGSHFSIGNQAVSDLNRTQVDPVSISVGLPVKEIRDRIVTF